MNQQFFREWKDKVGEINKIADEVDDGREEAYGLLAGEIKKIFARNGTVADNVHFNDDSSVITVKLAGNPSSSITFKKSFLIDISMSFSVVREITPTGNTILLVKLYPFEED